MQYLLVLNQCRDDQFSSFEQSGLKQKAQELGAKIIDLKRLYTPVMSKIDSQSLSFWAAKSADHAQSLGLLERQRVKIWLNHAYAEIAKVGV